MANSLVVTLLLKTGAFSNDIKKARGQVQQFQQGCSTAGKSLDAFGKSIGIDIGALTKFGSVIGVAAAAGAGLKKVIDSNQTSADAFQAVMYSAKTAVDELAYSIGTFDFTNFNDGLTGLINRAKQAASAIDQLGNTLMSYNVIQAKARLKISEAKAIINNPKSTKEQVEEAKRVMRDAMNQMRDSASVLLDDYKDALVAEVNAKGAKLSGEGAIDILDTWLTADAMGNRDAIKQKAKDDYKAYQDEVAALNNRYRPNTNTSFSNNFGTFSYSDDTWKNSPAYQSALAALNKQYESAIAYNVLLNKYSDEQLEKFGQQRIAMLQTEQTVADMTTQMEKVENKTNGSTKAAQKGTEVIKESLAYWQKISQEAQKNRDNAVYMSDAWVKANTELDEALRKMERITALTERAKTDAKYGDMMTTPLNLPKLEGQVVNTKPSDGLAGEKQNKIIPIEDLERELKAYQEVQKKTFDPKLLAFYNQRIKELSDQIEKMNKLGIETSPDKKSVDNWEEFNNAMANTATIVDAVSSSFQDGMKVTTASILKMVSTSLPAVGSLITALATLAGVEATEKAVSTAKHWIEAIAAVAALGATVATALSAAKKGGKFANGGIVGGSSFTGDRVTAQVNSGEMILNKAQQARLFKLANGGSVGGQQVEFHISGTELVGVLNNQNRKNNLIR